MESVARPLGSAGEGTNRERVTVLLSADNSMTELEMRNVFKRLEIQQRSAETRLERQEDMSRK